MVLFFKYIPVFIEIITRIENPIFTMVRPRVFIKKLPPSKKKPGIIKRKQRIANIHFLR
jgi:hypothetical protein